MSNSVPHTLGAFTDSFYYQHNRQPTPQEIFDAGMRGGRDIQWPTTVKPGWKLVPIVATQEMLEATTRTKPVSRTAIMLRQSVMSISAETWTEMIAASPDHEGLEVVALYECWGVFHTGKQKWVTGHDGCPSMFWPRENAERLCINAEYQPRKLYVIGAERIDSTERTPNEPA